MIDWVVRAALFVGLLGSVADGAEPLSAEKAVRGWMILSRSEPDAMATLAAARAYGINHLQLSHHLVHNLREIKDEKKRAVVNRLIDAGHAAGIDEVLLWDHALYSLDYYPQAFRTGANGTIDLDNPAFWEWLKADYRAMLDLVPKADGIVLTFIETGARAERQQSKQLATNQQKLAAVVNAVADVVIGERNLKLYARTFSYTHEEYDNVIGAVALFERPEVRLMMKETPHDFFLTHPNDRYAGTIDRPTLMEFDAAGEFNGQGIVANTWPEYVLRRWRDFARRPNIVGYVARTDRYGDTRLVGGPGEINLLALKRGLEDPQVTADQVTEAFITERYGAAALPQVKAAFGNALEIATCAFYTLGTNVANHSAIGYDPYASSYVLHVSGKWLDPPIGFVGHDVNREFHYWRDVVNHIAPPAIKQVGGRWREVPAVVKAGWIEKGESMNEQYLRYIVTEKAHGVGLAEQSLRQIQAAQGVLSEDRYQELHGLFERTLLTMRLHRAVASAYYGFRVWSRGGDHQTLYVREVTTKGLAEIKAAAAMVRGYPGKAPVGQWDWRKDADRAEAYYQWIVETGWPKPEKGEANPYAGMRFPLAPG